MNHDEIIPIVLCVVIVAILLIVGWYLTQPRFITVDGIDCIRAGYALSCNWDKAQP